MRANGDLEPEIILARRILLDAFVALAEHQSAFVLVGAQAVYLHVGDADLAVAPYTSDGDLAIDPDLLGDDPNLEHVLTEAMFEQRSQPGMWFSPEGVRIDLMVPAALGKRPGRRGADLGTHGKSVARQARGLECALVDNTIMKITSFEEGDSRSFSARVAGPTALLIAKLHKLSDRSSDTDRLFAKDALDVLRLLRGTSGQTVSNVLQSLSQHPIAGEVTGDGIQLLEELFSAPQSVGSLLAASAARPLEDEEIIKQSCAALARDLLTLLGR